VTVDRRAFTERTALAWNRSGLALAATGALVLRTAERTDRAALGEALAAVLFAAAASMLAYGEKLYRRRATHSEPEARGRALWLIAAVTVVVAAASLALALVG
jgi:uncharacterized membrane protein YidH (DUF202 family)